MKHAALIIAFSIFSLSAFAGRDAPDINKRIAHQEHKIQSGVARGDISAEEAEVLKAKTENIRSKKELFVKDGQVNRHERAILRHDLKENKKEMHYMKVNARHQKHKKQIRERHSERFH